jgi:hypothetical protein
MICLKLRVPFIFRNSLYNQIDTFKTKLNEYTNNTINYWLDVEVGLNSRVL